MDFNDVGRVGGWGQKVLSRPSGGKKKKEGTAILTDFTTATVEVLRTSGLP
jgi:hypothetical protein